MIDKNTENDSLIPIQDKGLLRVGSVLKLTKKLLIEFHTRADNHHLLLTESWEDFPEDWKLLLEIHIIFSKLGIEIDSDKNIEKQYSEIFKRKYQLINKTDNTELKLLSKLNLMSGNINDLTPLKKFKHVKELYYTSLANSIVELENIGLLQNLKYLTIFINTSDYSFFKNLTNLEELHLNFNRRQVLTKNHPLFSLINLKKLNVWNCKDVENFEDFEKLSSLEVLETAFIELKQIGFLKKNPLKTLRASKGSLNNEEILWLEENIGDLTLHENYAN